MVTGSTACRAGCSSVAFALIGRVANVAMRDHVIWILCRWVMWMVYHPELLTVAKFEGSIRLTFSSGRVTAANSTPLAFQLSAPGHSLSFSCRISNPDTSAGRQLSLYMSPGILIHLLSIVSLGLASAWEPVFIVDVSEPLHDVWVRPEMSFHEFAFRLFVHFCWSLASLLILQPSGEPLHIVIVLRHRQSVLTSQEPVSKYLLKGVMQMNDSFWDFTIPKKQVYSLPTLQIYPLFVFYTHQHVMCMFGLYICIQGTPLKCHLCFAPCLMDMDVSEFWTKWEGLQKSKQNICWVR